MKLIYSTIHVLRDRVVVKIQFWEDKSTTICLQEGLEVHLESEDIPIIQGWISEGHGLLDSFQHIEETEQEIQDFMNDLPDSF